MLYLDLSGVWHVLEMKFTAVVETARQLVSRGKTDEEGLLPALNSSINSSDGPQLVATAAVAERSVTDGGDDVIYGRVCTTVGEEPPLMLSSDDTRKSVFLFGPDAVEAIIVKQAAYNILCSIGRDKDYLYHMVC